MLSAKTTNTAVIQLHKGEPHIRTEIVILSPIGQDDGFANQLRLRLDLVQKIMTSINENVEEVISEQFNADIESVMSTVKNLKSRNGVSLTHDQQNETTVPQTTRRI